MNILTDLRVTEFEALVIVSILSLGTAAVIGIYALNHTLHALHQLNIDHLKRRLESSHLEQLLNAKADPLPLQLDAAKWLQANWSTEKIMKVHIVHELLNPPQQGTGEAHPTPTDRNSGAEKAEAIEEPILKLVLPKPEADSGQSNK